jgi:hypothetical protein
MLPDTVPSVKNRSVALAIALLLASATPAIAQPRIDPRIGQRLARGPLVVDRQARAIDVVATVHAIADVPRLSTLAGLSVHVVDGRPLHYRRDVLVRVTSALGLRSLAQASFVESVALAPLRGLRPLDRSAELIGLEGARGAGDPMEPWTGAGVIVADVDTPPDVYHPALFRGDAGWFDWIDVDHDGHLRPGVDAIDLDADGVADPSEIARVVRAAAFDWFQSGVPEITSVRSASFDPGLDWLYLDLDGNGRRGVGAEDGFDDTALALGEPLFTPDDVDRDGQLDPEERLVRLGSSKLRALFIGGGGIFAGMTFQRGESLARADGDYTGGIEGYSDTLHGSGVIGILAADLPLVGRRRVGIAPDADYVSAFSTDGSIAALYWALEFAPDVVIHEYVNWVQTPLDGSDPASTAIDDSTRMEHMAHVCPAGNIGGARKHAQATIDAATPTTWTLEIPDGRRYVAISLYAPMGAGLTVSFRDVDGVEHTPSSGRPEDAAGASLYYDRGRSTRGIDEHDFVLYTDESTTIPSGDVSVTITVVASDLVHGFVSDDVSGFALGAAWQGTIVTDASTIAWPATADACTAVGAVPAYTREDGVWAASGGERAHEIRGFSGRGPRIDGEARVHIVAPDNPISLLGHGPIYPQYPDYFVAPQGAYMPFGGTSGAGPHVAGVAALLAQRGVRGADVRGVLMDSAIDDGAGGTLPNDTYGAGRLSAVRALGGDPDGTAPLASLVASVTTAISGERFTLTPSATDAEGGALEVRWDDGYDGTWDTAYAPLEARDLRITALGVSRFKVRVRDASGRFDEAAIAIEVIAAPPDAGPPDAGPDASDLVPGGGGSCTCRIGTRASDGTSSVLVLIASAIALRRRAARS